MFPDKGSVEVYDPVRSSIYFECQPVGAAAELDGNPNKRDVVSVFKRKADEVFRLRAQVLFGVAIDFGVIVVDFHIEGGEGVQSENSVPVVGGIGQVYASGVLVMHRAGLYRVVVAVDGKIVARSPEIAGGFSGVDPACQTGRVCVQHERGGACVDQKLQRVGPVDEGGDINAVIGGFCERNFSHGLPPYHSGWQRKYVSSQQNADCQIGQSDFHGH